MKDTADQLRTLARATFSGFFESELMTPGLPQVRLVIFAIVALMFPATQLPLRAWQDYLAASRSMPEVLDLVMWPHKLLFITLAMVGTAVVALVIWDTVFPDRREAFVIGHLPIRTRTIVAARLIALAALMGLIALGTSLPSALFYGLVAGAYSPGGIPRTIVAHVAATMGASMFAFLLLLSLQGLLINVVPGRWLQRAMILLQFVFVVASLEALLFMHPIVDGLEKAMAPGTLAGESWMSWMPPAWFLGLYEVIAGTSRPIARVAVPTVVALAALLPLAFGLYLFTYQRLTRRAVEARDTERIGGSVGREPVAAWVGAALTRSSIANAVCRFTVVTLLRSRRHRLLLTIFAGVGTTAAATGVLVLPVMVLLAPLHVSILGLAAAVLHSVLLLAAGYLLAEIVLRGFRRVPFTSAYATPAARARVMWPFWLVGYLLYSFALSGIEARLLDRPAAAWGLVAAVAVSAVVVRRVRERDFQLATRMLSFDDGEDDAPVTLELSGITPVPASRH